MTPAAPNSTTIETSPRLPKAALGILVNGGEYPLLESLPHLESDARLLLNERIAGLGRELLALDDSRISLVNALLQQLQNGQDIEGLKSQLQILRQRAIDTGRRYGGLVARQRERRASYAGVLAGLEAMANSGTLSPDEVVNVQPLQSLNLRGSDARFTGDRRDIDDIDDILTLAAPRPERGPVWHTELRPGEQLRFSIRGNWSPTCAIGDVFFLFLDNDEYSRWSMPIGAVEAAETGPEGFTVQFGDQNLSAQSARSATTPVESCMVHVLPPVTRPRTRYEEADASNKCVDAEWQMIRERAQTQSLTAQFEVGLRLDDTPFPWAPAGSLVAVLIDQDGPRIIRDYQVVHRDSAIIAPKPPLDGAQNPLFTSYDVYLVVNDLGTCADPGTTPSLAISVSKVVPFGEAATALGEAMGTVLRDTEAQAPGIIEQGVFPASDQTQMRSMAWTTLQTKAKMDLNQVPAIRDLFTAWVDQQVASIDRRVQIADTQRNLAEMALEAQAIQQDLGSAGDQARLLRLVPRWRLHNLDQDALKADLRGVFSSLKDIFRRFSPCATRPPSRASARLRSSRQRWTPSWTPASMIAFRRQPNGWPISART